MVLEHGRIGNNRDGRIGEDLLWVHVTAVGGLPEALSVARCCLGKARLRREAAISVVPEDSKLHGGLPSGQRRQRTATSSE
jgi:hypothetical protein